MISEKKRMKNIRFDSTGCVFLIHSLSVWIVWYSPKDLESLTRAIQAGKYIDRKKNTQWQIFFALEAYIKNVYKNSIDLHDVRNYDWMWMWTYNIQFSCFQLNLLAATVSWIRTF